jgi:uroporphyrin-III C-methyltransferase
VVRLKGGDPMIFGRAQEEIDALTEAGIEWEVVPGITAALAAASVLGVSLTRRGIARTVAFLTPRVGQDETASEWLPAALGADSVVLYMAAGASQSIATSLIAGGKSADTPVALVESATLPEEKRLFTTLGAMREASLPRASGPVVMCVGEVFRDRAAVEEMAHESLMRQTASERCQAG